MIYDALFDWQKSLVDKIKDRKSYGLFLGCGAGKTVVALALAEVNRCDRVLIISIDKKARESDVIKGSWLWWAKKSAIPYTVYTKKVLKKAPQYTDDPSLLIMNYESMFIRHKAEYDERGKKKIPPADIRPELMQFLRSCKGHRLAIIADESHKLKDLQSLQTKVFKKIQAQGTLLADACYTYLATGTPFTKDYLDLHTQLGILGCPMTKTEFKDRFCIFGYNPYLPAYAQPIVGFKNIDLLFNLVHHYAVTIKTEDVVKLPKQVFVDYTTPQTEHFKMFTKETVSGKEIFAYAESRDIHDELPEVENVKTLQPNPFYRNIAFPSFDWVADTAGSYWMRARQLSIGFNGNAERAVWFDKSRLDALRNFLEDEPDNYILFYTYTPELLELYDMCVELGYDTDVISGEVLSTRFYEEYSCMTEAEKLVAGKRIVLANWASGSTGLNLQEYNKCIIFDLPTYGQWVQGLARISRTGQTHTTFYYLFYQDNFLDRSMMQALKNGVEYNEKIFEKERQTAR